MLTDTELYNSLHVGGTAEWQTNPHNTGTIVVAEKNAQGTALESFFSTEPADILLVIHQENIRLFDETMLAQLGNINLNEFSRIYINGTCKYVQGDLPELMKQIKEYYPEAIFPITVN